MEFSLAGGSDGTKILLNIGEEWCKIGFEVSSTHNIFHCLVLIEENPCPKITLYLEYC